MNTRRNEGKIGKCHLIDARINMHKVGTQVNNENSQKDYPTLEKWKKRKIIKTTLHYISHCTIYMHVYITQYVSLIIHVNAINKGW